MLLTGNSINTSNLKVITVEKVLQDYEEQMERVEPYLRVFIEPADIIGMAHDTPYEEQASEFTIQIWDASGIITEIDDENAIWEHEIYADYYADDDDDTERVLTTI